MLLKRFNAPQITYRSVDTVTEESDAVDYSPELLNSFNPPGFPQHMLTLKIGTPVILLRNIRPPELCNGTRLQVTFLGETFIRAVVFSGCGIGETFCLTRIPLTPNDGPLPFQRLHFPIRVCFAMTINKAQGQTLRAAGVDLRQPCFSHGQLYVAFSRVSSPKHLVVLQPDGCTRNVVYKEVFTS